MNTVALWVAVTMAAAPILPAASSFQSGGRVFEIDGLPIVLVPEAGTGRVTSQWMFDVGANHDRAADFGLAHLVEHLAFGRFDATSQEEYDSILGALGGDSSGWTDRERAGFGATIPLLEGGALARFVDLELTRRVAPLLDEATIDRQRAVVAQETAETFDRPHGPDAVWLDELLWAYGEPWSRHPRGAPTEKASPTPIAERWAWMQARGVLVLAGDLGLESWAARLGPAPASYPPHAPAPSLGEPGCEPAAPAIRWRPGNVAEGAVYMAWPIPGRDHPDRVALEALARWLGGAKVAVGQGCGEFVVERRGEWLDLGRHVVSLRRAVTELGALGLDPQSLDRVRAGQLTDLARANGVLETRARIVGACVLSGRGPDCLADEAVAWISLDSVATQKAAARWLLPDAATVLAVVPPDTLWSPPVPGMRAWGGR